MKLREYLESNGIKIIFFGRKLGVTAQYMHSIVACRREPSLSLALAIEEETKGKVKPRELALNITEHTRHISKRKVKRVGNVMAVDSTLIP